MTSPREPLRPSRVKPDVRLTIDEATVVLGILDLLHPPALSDPEPALIALVERTRGRLSAAITTAIDDLQRGGMRLA